MSITEKIKTIDNKIEQNKAQMIWKDKPLKVLLYHHETLVNMSS